MKYVYTVTMNRWADPENHHYLMGVFTSLETALCVALENSRWRAYKYEPYIEMFELDGKEHSVICKTTRQATQLLSEVNPGKVAEIYENE